MNMEKESYPRVPPKPERQVERHEESHHTTRGKEADLESRIAGTATFMKESKATTNVSQGAEDPAQEKSTASKLATQSVGSDTPQWVTGFALFRIMFALTLVSFLLLLDTSILAPVSHRIQ